MNTDKEIDFSNTPPQEVTEKIIGAAFSVSNSLGCGFLEKVYENAMLIELQRRGLKAKNQIPVGVKYLNQTVGDYVIDMVVENTVLVEIKATVDHHDIYEAQTINYLKATGLPVGLLLNFGRPKVIVRRFIEGKRKIDDVPGAKVIEYRQE